MRQLSAQHRTVDSPSYRLPEQDCSDWLLYRPQVDRWSHSVPSPKPFRPPLKKRSEKIRQLSPQHRTVDSPSHRLPEQDCFFGC